MQESLAQEILAKIASARAVTLVLHRGPDADSLGAAAAFAAFLNAKNIPYTFYCESELPPLAQFFGINDSNLITHNSSLITSGSVICTFDAGDLAHAGLESFCPSPSPLPEGEGQLMIPRPAGEDGRRPGEGSRWALPFIINFDHHASNTRFGNLNVVDTSCASTTELIYHFFQTIRFPISARVASYLLAGVLHDTDQFLNPATTASSLQMASELISRGVSLTALRELLFEQRGMNALCLIGDVLSRLRKNSRYNMAITYVTDEDARKYNMSFEEIADIANILNAVGDCRAMVVLKCEEGLVRCSMRTTRTDVDLGRLAEMLGGGGHRKAAGFRVNAGLTINGNRVRVE